MVVEADGYAEIVDYANGLVRVMRQHRLILPEEEDDYRDFLRTNI
jgi:hypothetical protein